MARLQSDSNQQWKTKRNFKGIVKGISSYFRDKSDFLQNIKAFKFLPDNSKLVSCDVNPLYTGIPTSKV